MMRVYLAGGLETAADCSALMRALEVLGHKITYDWTVHGAVPVDQCPAVAEAEINGVCYAHLLVVRLPGGRGTHVELGAALASSVPVLILAGGPVGDRAPSFYRHRSVTLDERPHGSPEEQAARVADVLSSWWPASSIPTRSAEAGDVDNDDQVVALAGRVRSAMPDVGVFVGEDSSIHVDINLLEEGHDPLEISDPCIGVVDREEDGWVLSMSEEVRVPFGDEDRVVQLLVDEGRRELKASITRAREVLGQLEAMAPTWGAGAELATGLCTGRCCPGWTPTVDCAQQQPPPRASLPLCTACRRAVEVMERPPGLVDHDDVPGWPADSSGWRPGLIVNSFCWSTPAADSPARMGQVGVEIRMHGQSAPQLLQARALAVAARDLTERAAGLAPYKLARRMEKLSGKIGDWVDDADVVEA